MSGLSEFKKLNPLTFKEKPSPLIDEEWAEQVNWILDTMQGPKKIWVKLTTFQLLEQANH